jgi:hypothetical protein
LSDVLVGDERATVAPAVANPHQDVAAGLSWETTGRSGSEAAVDPEFRVRACGRRRRGT